MPDGIVPARRAWAAVPAPISCFADSVWTNDADIAFHSGNYYPAMNQNPYQSPTVGSSMAAEGSVSPATINLLVRTQPWVRLISIVGLVVTAFVFLALILGALGIGAMTLKHGSQGAPMIAMLLPGLIVLILYIYPLLKLSAYAAGIRRLKFSGSVNDLNYALDQQRAFWKFMGVLMLIAVTIWLLAFLAGLGGALMMSRSGSAP